MSRKKRKGKVSEREFKRRQFQKLRSVMDKHLDDGGAITAPRQC